MRAPIVVVGIASALVMCAGCAANDDGADGGGVQVVATAAPPDVGIDNAGSDPTEAAAVTSAPTTATPSTIPATTAAPLDLASTDVVTEAVATFDAPVSVAVRPGDDSVYVVEQGGTVQRLAADGTTEVALDITDRTEAAGERGLLGLAFHPSQPLAYVNYTDLDGTSVVAEFAVGDGGLDVATQRVVLTLEQPYGNHNGGDLAFGPDEMLYIGFGDGGSADDPERRASDPDSWLGSMLRIDPTGRDDGEYSIPADNPFGTEVWAYGLRNPWRFVFDGDDLWIADVGQNQFEEVNLVRPGADGTPAGKGADFGWSAYEATTRFNDDVPVNDDRIEPVLFYEHGPGCSVSGAAMIDEWFIYGDFCSGAVFAFEPASGRNITIAEGYDGLTAVRNAPDGGVYLLQAEGAVTHLGAN